MINCKQCGHWHGNSHKAHSTLKNGATEIARIQIGDSIAVLAKRDADYEPFVTWRMDDRGNCFWGHYFATHNEAAADLLTRV